MKRVLSVLMAVTLLALLSGAYALPSRAAVNTTGFTAEVIRLVNVERAKAGKPALRSGGYFLNAAALVRAKEYAANPALVHKRPGNKDFSTVLDAYGISWTASGENLARGQTTPAQVVADWMGSAGHKKNILYDFDKIGVAVYESDGRLYWAQLFVRNDYGFFAGLWNAFTGFFVRIFSVFNPALR